MELLINDHCDNKLIQTSKIGAPLTNFGASELARSAYCGTIDIDMNDCLVSASPIFYSFSSISGTFTYIGDLLFTKTKGSNKRIGST